MHIGSRLGLVLAVAALVGTTPVAAQGKAPAAGPTPALAQKGDSIFHGPGLCYACHGANAQGAVGPQPDRLGVDPRRRLLRLHRRDRDLRYSRRRRRRVASRCRPKGGSSISDEDVKAVAAYVYSLSHKLQ